MADQKQEERRPRTVRINPAVFKQRRKIFERQNALGQFKTLLPKDFFKNSTREQASFFIKSCNDRKFLFALQIHIKQQPDFLYDIAVTDLDATVLLLKNPNTGFLLSDEQVGTLLHKFRQEIYSGHLYGGGSEQKMSQLIHQILLTTNRSMASLNGNKKNVELFESSTLAYCLENPPPPVVEAKNAAQQKELNELAAEYGGMTQKNFYTLCELSMTDSFSPMQLWLLESQINCNSYFSVEDQKQWDLFFADVQKILLNPEARKIYDTTLVQKLARECAEESESFYDLLGHDKSVAEYIQAADQFLTTMKSDPNVSKDAYKKMEQTMLDMKAIFSNEPAKQIYDAMLAEKGLRKFSFR